MRLPEINIIAPCTGQSERKSSTSYKRNKTIDLKLKLKGTGITEDLYVHMYITIVIVWWNSLNLAVPALSLLGGYFGGNH